MSDQQKGDEMNQTTKTGSLRCNIGKDAKTRRLWVVFVRLMFPAVVCDVAVFYLLFYVGTTCEGWWVVPTVSLLTVSLIGCAVITAMWATSLLEAMDEDLKDQLAAEMKDRE